MAVKERARLQAGQQVSAGAVRHWARCTACAAALPCWQLAARPELLPVMTGPYTRVASSTRSKQAAAADAGTHLSSAPCSWRRARLELASLLNILCLLAPHCCFCPGHVYTRFLQCQSPQCRPHRASVFLASEAKLLPGRPLFVQTAGPAPCQPALILGSNAAWAGEGPCAQPATGLARRAGTGGPAAGKLLLPQQDGSGHCCWLAYQLVVSARPVLAPKPTVPVAHVSAARLRLRSLP